MPIYLSQIDGDAACFVDTSILFSATYSSDSFNEESDTAFNRLAKAGCALFTNVNVRSEFLENHRRVLIPEALVDLLGKLGAQLDPFLCEKLKSHRTAYKKRVEEEKNTKMDAHQIKEWRRILARYSFNDMDGWSLFCRDFMSGKIHRIWNETERHFSLNFISSRSGDNNPNLNQIPNWEDAIDLMEKYGIASSDAMILNMFLCSKIPVLLTADLEMAEAVLKESKSQKRIFVPDSLLK